MKRWAQAVLVIGALAVAVWTTIRYATSKRFREAVAEVDEE